MKSEIIEILLEPLIQLLVTTTFFCTKSIYTAQEDISHSLSECWDRSGGVDSWTSPTCHVSCYSQGVWPFCTGILGRLCPHATKTRGWAAELRPDLPNWKSRRKLKVVCTDQFIFLLASPDACWGVLDLFMTCKLVHSPLKKIVLWVSSWLQNLHNCFMMRPEATSVCWKVLWMLDKPFLRGWVTLT